MRFLNPFLKNKANLALAALILAFFVLWPHTAVQAIPVETIVDVPATTKTVVDNVVKAKDKWWQTFAAKLVGTTLRNTINRIAYDAANTIATAGEGQKPLWVVEDLGTYFSNLGDAAAGDFIDSLGSKWQVDLCQPPDPAIKAKIGLGLVQQQRPTSPNCSLSKLASNYASAWEKYSAMKAGDYLKAVQVSFEPGGSDISTAFTLFGRTEEAKIVAKDAAKDEVGIKSGWLDVRNAAGKLRGLPDSQKTALQLAQENQSATLLSTTGDALVDAANIFLNQLAYEGMQRALRELGKGKSTSAPYSYSAVDSLIQYGEKVVSEKLASFIKPKFDVRSDYSVLSDLATCADKANPGPNNCVIDDNFSQAISEKLTVAEALNKGYLHGDWLISDNSKLENTYTLRSANILRKFRIIPVGWEQAIMVAARNKYKATISDLISCYSPNDEYVLFSDNFDKGSTSWCEGLVDPNWVLKAPTGSCLKQGVGSQILSSLQSKTETGLSSIEVTRATDYCADEQTCIKEKNDGSCEVQGYCNEEKRTWNFNADTCEPVYNTCQSFTNTASSQVVSYLENTLDYGTCNSSNAGCRQYVFGGTYDDANKQVLWDKKYSIYLNNQAQDCNQKDEGCTKLLRGKPGWDGVNFVMNSDFSANSVGDSLSSGNLRWPVTATTANIVNFDGGRALYLEGSTASVYSDSTNNILPKGMTVIPGWSYTLSADVYIDSGSKVTMSFTEDNLSQETTVQKSWQKLSVSVLTRDYTINDLKFSITGIGGVKMYVKNIQLTPNDSSIGYTSYAAYPAYEKVIPVYLESACYVNPGSDYRLKANAPAICSTFARKCNRAEAGCDMFTSAKDGFKVAAKAQPADYCVQECAGYDVYIAHESYFYNSSADNLLPAKTKTCSAQSVGCSGFTNLDEISQGGEKQDYYTYIRQCIKPDASACGDFYSWEGDNATGYQLKASSLKKDSAGNPALVNGSLASACTKEIYYLPTSDPRFNPDCREFYNKNGSIAYRLLSNTFSCSDNCHPYRLNEKNIDSNLTQAACSGSDKSWDVNTNSCYVCKNGGTWSSQYNSCIYNAVPGEGSSCSAAEAGCREYNGNGGGNLRLAGTYSFESGTDPFKAISGTVGQSLESTAKDGHSLSYSGGEMEIDAANFAKNGSSYVIKFMAKASAPVTFNAYFENANAEKTEFNVSDLNKDGTLTIKGNNSWNLYEINSAAITHTINTEKLKIKVSGAIFIDNFVINEVTDRYYLVKGTSQVPEACYYDIFGKYQGPNYNLGCSLYTDISKTNNYLHSFSELCQDSAAGCEQMIETSNSLSPYGKTINLNDVNRNVPCTAGSTGCINVPGHKITYAVYDPTKACVKDDMACTRFAYSQTTSGSVNTVWVDSYKKNLPDSYDSILCQSSEVGCEEWSYGNDNARLYFKNPGSNVCIFKLGAWYKAPVKRCDADGSTKINGAEQSSAICNNDTECGGKKCIIDTNNYLCDTTYLKTIGNGGAAGAITTPSNAAALCESGASGCTEFIDPVSGYMDNVAATPITKIKQNSLYIVNGPATLSSFKVTDSGTVGTVRILGADNKLGSLVASINVPAGSSVIFHTALNTQFNLANTSADTKIKQAIINYKINDGENIDTRTCNGVINTENGCVLFNTRSRGAGALTFNAYATAEGAAAVACSGNNCSANQVIKVRPDRVCSRWLTCTSYIIDPVTKEKTCYAMGECDKLNEKNECGNVIAPTTELRSIDVGTGPTQFWNTLTNRNATGYALLNNYYLGSMKEVGQNTDAHFDFESANVNLSCKRLDGSNQACKWDGSISKDSLVLEPNNSPTGIDYPAHGKGYLRVLNYYKISPQPDNSYVSIFGGQDYYINYLVNTKKSINRAKLIIVDDKDNVIVTAVDTTANGWERKVVKFQVGAVGSGLKQIKIYLTTDLAGSDLTSPQISYVYYDDINIEPVLQVAPDKYVAKDCRLYPGADSLTCLSVNNNVVKDGLYGYCLQYDPNNTNVCLMWYPIDQISPTARINQSSLGYKGKFPLYYCTEVNGEFNLMKKIRAVKVATWSNEKNEREDNCKIKPLADCKNMCGADNCDKYDFVILRKQGVHDSWSYGEAWCIPKQRTIGNIGTEQKSFDTLSPDADRCEINFYEEAWANFGQGFSYVRGNNDGSTNGFVNLTSFAWTDPVPDEANIPIPNIAVYDKNTPPVTSDDLKFVSSSDPDKVYRLTCSRFTQLVDAAGSNMAWTDRVGRNSLFPNDTPNYFISSATENPANINYYKDNLKKIIGVPHTFTGCSKTGTGAACSTVERGVMTITKSAGATDPIFVNCNSLYLESYTDSCRCLDVKSSKEICGSDDYVAIGSADLEGNGFDLKSYAVHALYFCIPRQDKLVIKTGSKTLDSPKDFACSVTFQEGSVVNKGLVSDPYVFDPSYYNPNTDVSVSSLRAINESAAVLGNTAPDPKAKPILSYGRNREDVPFGSAILPSDYSLTGSSAINLRNQYSDRLRETMLAGRPYGCSFSNGAPSLGCSYIGQCNINRNIFCIYTGNTTVDKQGCAAAGGGECVPLWRTPLVTTSTLNDSANVLSKIFVKNYSNFSLNSDPNPVYEGDNTLRFYDSNILSGCPNDVRPSDSPASFCYVRPAIKNMKIQRIESSGAATGGLYKLSFNSQVDIEQQPLKQIIINWGGSLSDIQTVTNLDNKPDTGISPHEFYHYYLGGTNPIVKVMLMDNWNKYNCSDTSGGNACPW